ncbi:hypothetical protein ES705_08702 [subsurface metagenome]
MINIEERLRNKIEEMKEEYKKELEGSMKDYLDMMKGLDAIEKEFPHPIIKEMKQDMEKSIDRVKEAMKDEL